MLVFSYLYFIKFIGFRWESFKVICMKLPKSLHSIMEKLASTITDERILAELESEAEAYAAWFNNNGHQHATPGEVLDIILLHVLCKEGNEEGLSMGEWLISEANCPISQYYFQKVGESIWFAKIEKYEERRFILEFKYHLEPGRIERVVLAEAKRVFQ